MKNRKKYSILFVVLLSFFILLRLAFSNIEQVTQFILKEVVNTNISIGSIETKGLNIEIRNITLAEYNGEKIGNIEKLNVKINPFLPTRLVNIKAVGGNLKIVQYKDRSLNLNKIFMPSTDTYIKRNSYVGNLEFANMNVIYVDKTYKYEIEKKLSNVNGSVNDLLTTSFSVKAKGYSMGEITQEKEELGIELTNVLTNKYSILSIFSLNKLSEKQISYSKFNFKNVDVTKELSQFLPLDFITINKGKIDGELIIQGEELYGDLKASSTDLEYADYNDKIDSAKLDIHLDSNKINAKGIVDITSDILNLNIDFDLKENYLSLLASANKIGFDKLRKYSLLESINLDIQGKVDFEVNLGISIKNDKVDISQIKANIKSDILKYANIEILDTSIIVNKKEKENAQIEAKSKLKNEFIDFDIDTNMSMDLENEKAKSEISIRNNIKELNIQELKLLLDINSFSDINIKSNDEHINLEAVFKDKKFQMNLNTLKNIVYKAKDFTVDSSLSIKDLKYSLDDNKLESNIDVNANISYLTEKISIDASSVIKDSNINSSIKIGTRNQILNIIGNTDFNFNHKYIAKGNLNLLTVLKTLGHDRRNIKDASLLLKVDASIYGKNKDINLNYIISGKNINYMVEIPNLTLVGNINNLFGDIKVNSKLKIDELWYMYHRLDNIYGDVDFSNNKLIIKNIKNEYINANFEYDIKNKNLDFSAKLKDYVIYTTNSIDVNIKLKELDFKVNGRLDTLSGTIDVKTSKMFINKKYIGQVKVDANIQDGIINLDAYINDNKLNAKYDISSEKLIIDAEIDDDIRTYLDIEDFNAKVKSKIHLEAIKSKLDAQLSLELNNIKYRQYEAPNISIEANYQNGDITNILKTGFLHITNFVVKSKKDDKEIYKTSMDFDLSILNIDYESKDNKFNLSKLGSDFSGEITYSAIVRGNLDRFFTEVSLNADNIIIQNNKISNLDISAQANENGININQGYLEYENNPINIMGYVFFKTSEYFLSVVAENFNLEFLNIGSNISNTSGIANINFTASNDSVYGIIDIRNLNMSTKDYNIRDFNVNIDMLNDEINIKEFKGYINKGLLEIKGSFSLPTVENNGIILRKFNLVLNANKIPIKYSNNEITFSSNLEFKSSDITGNLVFNKAKISNLSFLDNKSSGKKGIISKKLKNIIDDIMKQIRVSINFAMEKPIEINIDNYLVIRNIKGYLYGESLIQYINSRLYLIGEFSTDSTTFEFNNNMFTMETLNVVLQNRGEEGIDPYINLKAVTNINGEDIEIYMNSLLSEKKIEFKSQSNKTKDEILSLLTIGSNILNLPSIRALGNNVVNTVTETAINQFISSITNRIGKRIGLTKFEINASVLEKDKFEFTKIFDNAALEIETQGKLLKDKNIYWNVNFAIPLNTKKAEDLKYDVSVSYKINEGLDANIGIKSDNLDFISVNGEKIIYRINFYTGVNYSNKFNNISEFKDQLNNMFRKKEKLIQEKKEYDVNEK